MAEPAFEQWQRNPADLAQLTSWVSEAKQQSRQEAAIRQLEPLAREPMEEAVAAGVYSALFTLELDLGRMRQANEWVTRLAEVDTSSFRVPYFRGLMLRRLNRLEDAKGYFYEAIKRDKSRPDSWDQLLDCCAKTRDFQRAMQLLLEVRRLPWSSGRRRLWCYLQGCLYQRMTHYSLAMVSFAEVILDCAARGVPAKAKAKPRLSTLPPEAPRAALTEAIALLEARGLRPFPTAGTLLGWWREGTFLGHDKDIDIMLPPGSDWDTAFRALAESPAFTVMPNEMGYTNFQSFAHRNTGLVVDLSQHEKDEDGSVRCVWRIPGVPDDQCRRTRQSAYQLVRDQWLGCDFWRPEAPDRFLTELYGDWRTPMLHFDTLISGQHVVGFPDVVRCYAYNRLADALHDGNRERAFAYVSQILAKEPLDPMANHLKNLLANKHQSEAGQSSP